MKRALWFLLPLCFIAPLARGQALAVFTAAQAAQGKAFYAHDCAACHGPAMEGEYGPPLTGPAFSQSMAGQNRTVASLLDVIRFTMPYDSQGNLPDAEYEAVTAYLLQQSGYPAGSEKLSIGNSHLSELKLGP